MFTFAQNVTYPFMTVAHNCYAVEDDHVQATCLELTMTRRKDRAPSPSRDHVKEGGGGPQ